LKVDEMASRNTTDELTALYDALVPVLARASIGDFNADITVDPTHSEQAKELLIGVQVLLEVIREKIDELETANAKMEAARDRSVSVLDEVLRKSLE